MEVQSLAWSFYQLLWPGPMDPTFCSWTVLPGLVVCVCVCVLSGVQLFAIPWTAARQAPLSMGFPRQQYWSGLPCPPPGDPPDPGTEPSSLASLALAGGFFTIAPPGKLGLVMRKQSVEDRERKNNTDTESRLQTPFLGHFWNQVHLLFFLPSPVAQGGKESTCKVGDLGSIQTSDIDVRVDPE